MRISSIFRLGIMLVLAGVIGSPVSRVQARLAQAPEKYAELLAKAEADGSVRVILQLDIGAKFIPEGYLLPEEVEKQRQAIREAQQTLSKAVEGYQVTFNALYKYVPHAALEVDKDALELIGALPVVQEIQEDELSRTTLASSTLLIGAPAVWEAGVTGSGVTVAILDTGIQWEHPFFAGPTGSRVVYEACYSNAGNGGVTLCPNGEKSQTTGHAADATTIQCAPATYNLCAHGTHVAGIAAGSGTSYKGVAPGANIIAIQVFTRFTPGACNSSNPCVMSYTSDQMSGLQRIYELRSSYTIAAVNMSLGGGVYAGACDANPLRSYIRNLHSVGITTAIASGNDGSDSGISAPACITEAVAVGATTDIDTVADFSNSSTLIDLLAPGVSVDSSIPTSAYANYQGTSMATPHVAGAFTLLKSFNSGLTADQILAALQTTGISVTDTRNGVTKPRLQLDAAVNSASTELTWLGYSNVWETASNWSTSQVPTRSNSVIIPASPAGGNFPAFNTTGSVYNLTVQDGASMQMTGGTLNVLGNFMVEGGVGGTFNASGGTAVFQGLADQVIAMPENASNHFYNLQIGSGSTRKTVTAGSTLDVNGNLTIASGARFSPGSHTVRVAGNWVDTDGLFIPGTSTIALDGSGQSAQVTNSQFTLLQETFLAYDSLPDWYADFNAPAGWRVENTLGGDYPWFFMGWTRSPNTLPNGHVRHFNLNGDEQTKWLFTPGLSLYSGISYQLSYKYGVFANARTLGVWMGAAQTSAGMTTRLQDITARLASWSTDVVNFTVPADGTYYIGFLAHTPVGQGGDGISVDDITVTGTPQLIFHNLDVSAGGTGLVLGDHAMVKNNLVVNSGGHLDLAGYNLTVEGTLTNNGRLSQTKSAPAATLTSFLRLTNLAATTTKYYGVDITPAAAMGSTTVSIMGNQAACTSNPADALIGRCYAITPGANQNATVRLWYTEAERNGQRANGLNLWHGTSTPPYVWSQVGDGYAWSEGTPDCTSGSGLACWMQANNVSTYSPFGLGSGGTPTAIRLSSLKAASGGSRLPLLALAAAIGLAAVGLLLRRWKA